MCQASVVRHLHMAAGRDGTFADQVQIKEARSKRFVVNWFS